MGRIERSRELARRRHRKVKLQKLRQKFAQATTPGERQALVEKARRLSPFASLEAAPARAE